MLPLALFKVDGFVLFMDLILTKAKEEYPEKINGVADELPECKANYGTQTTLLYT